MSTVVAHRHRTRFYGTLFLGSLFYLGLGTGMALSHSKGFAIGPVMTVPMYLMAGFSIWRYYRNAPPIRIDSNSIAIGSNTYALSTVKDIQFTGKQNFPYIISFPMEAATLTFSDGKQVFVYDDMYQNSGELKSYLQSVKKGVPMHRCLPVTETRLHDLETFKGLAFLSFRGILIVLFFVFLCTIAITGKNVTPQGALMILLCAFFWLAMGAMTMYYFQVSGRFLVVRNHFFFWKKTVYRISDIQEVVYEKPGRMPNCMRIITKDFNTKHYAAASLGDKVWKALRAELNGYGVRVRKEWV